jgi:hypothetical protein
MKWKYTLLIFILAGAGLWIFQRPSPPSQRDDSSVAADESSEKANTTLKSSTSHSPSAPTAQSPSRAISSSKTERASLEDMSRSLFEFTRPQSRLSDLVQYLEGSRQQPFVTRDANPDTGEMLIVRTKSPLPGTRYFHAQYFSNENNEPFVQHMSFEYKPSLTAMQEALQAVEKSFPDLPAPEVKNDGFAKWNLKGGYILWVKKMKAEDLQDDPFNAYTAADEGTVRVAMELEIHQDEHTR